MTGAGVVVLGHVDGAPGIVTLVWHITISGEGGTTSGTVTFGCVTGGGGGGGYSEKKEGKRMFTMLG